jgi:hypothetical protein
VRSLVELHKSAEMHCRSKESSTWSCIRYLVSALVQAEVGSIVVVRQPLRPEESIEVGRGVMAEIEIESMEYLGCWMKKSAVSTI